MICLEQIAYQYQGRKDKQLKDIDLCVKDGEFLLITGRSGCGKTTLSECINGLIPHFREGALSGKAQVNGKNIKEENIGTIGEIAGSVFQNPRTQFFTTETTDELAFGCRNMLLSREEVLRRIDEAFRTFHMEDLKDRSLFELSSGEKQKIAIASCYCMKPEIFLFDEPSANLDPEAIEELKKVLKWLKEQGHTVIILEHRLYYLGNLMDRMIYMKEGRIEREFKREEALALSKEELIEMGLRSFHLEKGRTAGLEDAEAKLYGEEKGSGKEEAPFLEVRNLSFAYKNKRKTKGYPLGISSCAKEEKKGCLKGINFSAKRGQIIGIVGKNGAGKTTFTRLLAGLLKPQEGEIRIDGKAADMKERGKQTYIVLQDSDYQIFTDNVLKEVKLGNEDREGLDEECEKILRKLGLWEYRDSHPAALSRGQKQRITIAGAMLSNAPILIFDEPTSGLDGESMREVKALMKSIREEGKLQFVISHDYEFLSDCCDRVIEVRNGQIEEAGAW